MSGIKKRAANAAWWSVIEISSRYSMQFAVMVVLARILMPEDFGLIAMLMVFTSIGALLVDSGFGTALIQRQQTTPDDETTMFIFSISVGLLTSVVLIISASPISIFFEQPKLLELIRVMALTLPLGALAAVPDALLTMRLDFKARARAEVTASVISGIAAIMLAYFGFGVWSLVWQAIVGLMLRSMLLWLYSNWRPRGRFSSASFRNLFGFGAYMLLSALLNTATTQVQSLLLGKLYDSRTLGFYSLAQNTQQAPTSFMASILNRVGLPVFSAISEDADQLLMALRRSLRMAMFLFVPGMVGIALVAKPLMELLYGERWVSAAPILRILAVSAALWPMHVLNLAAISAQGRSDLFFRLTVIKHLAAMALIVVCSPAGPNAIAWAVFASSIFSVFVNTHYSKKLLGYGAAAQFVDQLATFALSATAAIVGWAILHWTRPGLLTMLAAVVAAATTYLSIAFIIRSDALKELLGVATVLRARSEANPA